MKKYRTPKQIAAEMDIPERTVYRMCASGQLPSYRVGGRWRIIPDFKEDSEKIDKQIIQQMRDKGW